MSVFEALQQILIDKEDLLKSALYSNQIADMETYRYTTGQLRGLAVARNVISDLESSQYESENDD